VPSLTTSSRGGGYGDTEDKHASGEYLSLLSSASIDTWVKVPGKMQCARARCAAASLFGKFYVIGGVGDGQVSATVDYYDSNNPDGWVKGPDLRQGRESHGALVVLDRVYVVGGTGLDGDLLDTIEEACLFLTLAFTLTLTLC